MTAAGWKQSAIWLPPKAVARLEQLCQLSDLTRQEVITRLILDAEDTHDSKPPSTPTKTPAKKKKATSKKKKATTRKKKRPAVELDVVGLERPVGYEDWEAAVFIRIDKGINNLNGEHVDWNEGIPRHSYIWDSEEVVEEF